MRARKIVAGTVTRHFFQLITSTARYLRLEEFRYSYIENLVGGREKRFFSTKTL